MIVPVFERFTVSLKCTA